jgi:hypothetical protein
MYNYLILSYYFVACFLINSFYEHFQKNLSVLYPKFNKYDDRRQKYIIKNIIKSNALYAISLLSFPMTIAYQYSLPEVNTLIQFVGMFYVANDSVGLYKVKNLGPATTLHHIISTSLGLLTPVINFYDPVPQMLLIYALVACYSYNVNYYLGIRFLKEREETKNLKNQAFMIYFLLCLCNFGYHGYWLYDNLNNLTNPHIIYYTVITPLIYDDLKLLKFLYN